MNLFLADVVRDMTQKTGQKCTAIRRVYVPTAKRRDGHRAAPRAPRARSRSAIPTREEVTMGPAATAQQLRDVRDGIEQARRAWPSRDRRRRRGRRHRRTERQGFLRRTRPALRRIPEPGTRSTSTKSSGPSRPSCPTTAPLQQAGGARRCGRRRSRHQRLLGRQRLLRAPSWASRRSTAASSSAPSKSPVKRMPPGMVLPQLVHGGPGRAGGGEELGGRRGLAFYMQRVALQGDRALIDGLLAKR